jgi:MFS family permease
MNGIIFLTALNLQQVQDFSPFAAGLGLLPPILIITVFAGPSGALADKIGPRLLMGLGSFIVAAGMSLLTTGGPDASYFRHFLPGLTLFGIGMTLVIPALTKSALSVEPRFSGSASGINNGMARVAGLLAIAVLGAVALSTFTAALEGAVGASGLNPEQQLQILTQADKLGGIVIPDTFNEQARQAATQAIQSSFAHGFRWAMGICAGLAVASGLVCLATIRQKPPATVGS